MKTVNAQSHSIKFAAGSLIWGIILIVWSGYLALLFIQGTLTTYVHPRMIPFILGAMFCFALLGIVTLYHAFQDKGFTVTKPGFALFVIPLSLAISAGPKELSELAAEQRVIKTADSTLSNFTNINEYLTSLKSTDPIVFEDWSHAALLGAISANPDSFVNRTIELVGFVFRPPATPQERLYITRFLITCCVADAEPLGLLVEGTDMAQFENYEWIKVQGTLKTATVQNPYTGKDEVTPILYAKFITKTEKPISEYLFPRN